MFIVCSMFVIWVSLFMFLVLVVEVLMVVCRLVSVFVLFVFFEVRKVIIGLV